MNELQKQVTHVVDKTHDLLGGSMAVFEALLISRLTYLCANQIKSIWLRAGNSMSARLMVKTKQSPTI